MPKRTTILDSFYFQLVVEFARHVCGLDEPVIGKEITEKLPSVIALLPEQNGVVTKVQL
jgi:hypothetical protein